VVLVAIGTEHGARDLQELSERRVALERVRERLGARIADVDAVQAAARRKRVSGARGDRHRARRLSSAARALALYSLHCGLALADGDQGLF
jgi:hypothetical protein